MNTCPNCGHNNRVGLLFCEDCSKPLSVNIATVTIGTKKIKNDPNEAVAKATWGTAHLSSTVILHIQDATEPILLHPNERTVFGRADSSNSKQPDIDLTLFGALEKGVSRAHATIERGENTLTLIDMGSSNGTHLNGQRLVPDQPRVLRDGDEIHFGKLIAHVYFK